MSWVAVGVAAVSVVTQVSAGQKAKKAAAKEAEANRAAGEARKKAAEFEANVLDMQASNVVGAAQRDMLDVQRMTRLAESRATALAAASGGGATAPTVTKIISDIAKEGSYNAARALYAGEERGRLMQLQAQQLREQGEYAQITGNLAGAASEARGKAAQMQSFANVVSTVGGLYGKYGGSFTASQQGAGVDIGGGGAGDLNMNYG